MQSASPFARSQNAWIALEPVYKRWFWRLLGWGIIWYVTRYVLFGAFYQASPTAQTILSAIRMTQLIVTYYLFAYFIFPKTIYKGRIDLLIVVVIIWHVLIYQSNYWSFYWLQKIDGAGRVKGSWEHLNEWGIWGAITSTQAIVWNLFWSITNAAILLTIKAITEFINLRTHTLKLEKDKLALELDFLKSQINPHFLFNTLNSVYARVFDIDERAADSLLRLSELMRYSLYETDQPQIELDKELTYIQNYLELERNRLESQPVTITYEQSGEAKSQHISPLLLVAFVENAFKHGVKGQMKNAFVRVRAVISENLFRFTVENSIAPNRQLTDDPVKKAGGIGLINVHRRLNTIYPARYTLNSTAHEGHYLVELTIQL